MIAYQTKNPFPLWKYDTTGNNGCQSEYSKNVCAHSRYRNSHTFTGVKSKDFKLRARMLMRTKVSMHVETVVLMSKKN